ncbi:MAG: histidinol-phosphatase [Planctomycetota bacterium]
MTPPLPPDPSPTPDPARITAGHLSLTVWDAEPAAPPSPPGLATTPPPLDDAPAGENRPRVLYESHLHTPFCKHARGRLEQYAAVALERGLAGITATCHNPMPDGYADKMRMAPDQLDEYVMYVQRARHVFEGRLDVRLGLEADYVPGYEKHLEQQLAAHDFDFVLGSVHPQIPEYQGRYYAKDNFKFQQQYFTHLAESAETGLFDSLAHPDLIKHLMPRSWSVSKIMDDACRALDRIAKTGVAMEFNTSGWRRPLQEPSPGPRLLYEMARRRIPLTLGADAHSPPRVGFGFRKALRLIQAAGYRHVTVFKQRTPQTVSIGEAYRTLTPDPVESAPLAATPGR